MALEAALTYARGQAGPLPCPEHQKGSVSPLHTPLHTCAECISGGPENWAHCLQQCSTIANESRMGPDVHLFVGKTGAESVYEHMS